MGCSLCWKPISKKSHSVGSYQLRDLIEKKFGYPCKLDVNEHYHYIDALIDAGVDGAKELQEALLNHDQIELYLEC